MAETSIGPGSVLAGRFVLEDLLDETEGAKFWRATDKVLARNVAVHVIGSDDPRADALVSAARTSATVSDGHLLRVLDAATVDGYTYVVNEWGNGVSLDRLVAEGPLPPRRAAWVAKEVAEAISTAHRHGIAHGRLLPENVVITESGSVKLVGFVVDAVLNGRESVRVSGGPPLSEHEADVVNLAGLLYAGLVARWPGTEGSTVLEAPTDQGHPLRPRQVRAGVPRPLDAICERVLNADNNHHVTPIETAHEVYAALCDYIGDPSSPPPLGEPLGLLDDELDDIAGAPTQASPALRDDPEATQAAPGPLPFVDPDATQAGVPDLGDTRERMELEELREGTERTRVVPPPPPFDEPEPRPLFASDEPRRPHPGHHPRSTGFGSGTIPPVWGPDVDEPTGGGRRDDTSYVEEPPGRSWLRLAYAIAGVLVLVIAIVFAFNLGRDATLPEDDAGAPPSEQSQPRNPRPVALDATMVDDFDPEGDGQVENPESVPLTVDGNPTTAWRTSTYFDPLSLQKSGVGLMIDLGKATDVADVELRLLGSGTDVELRAAPDATARPSSPEQMRVVAQQAAAGTQVTLAPDRPVNTQFLLVWLTELPAVDGGYRGEVAEVVVRS